MNIPQKQQSQPIPENDLSDSYYKGDQDSVLSGSENESEVLQVQLGKQKTENSLNSDLPNDIHPKLDFNNIIQKYAKKSQERPLIQQMKDTQKAVKQSLNSLDQEIKLFQNNYLIKVNLQEKRAQRSQSLRKKNQKPYQKLRKEYKRSNSSQSKKQNGINCIKVNLSKFRSQSQNQQKRKCKKKIDIKIKKERLKERNNKPYNKPYNKAQYQYQSKVVNFTNKIHVIKPFTERNQRWERGRKMKVKQMKTKQEKDILRQCTFKPNLRKSSKNKTNTKRGEKNTHKCKKYINLYNSRRMTNQEKNDQFIRKAIKQSKKQQKQKNKNSKQRAMQSQKRTSKYTSYMLQRQENENYLSKKLQQVKKQLQSITTFTNEKTKKSKRNKKQKRRKKDMKDSLHNRHKEYLKQSQMLENEILQLQLQCNSLRRLRKNNKKKNSKKVRFASVSTRISAKGNKKTIYNKHQENIRKENQHQQKKRKRPSSCQERKINTQYKIVLSNYEFLSKKYLTLIEKQRQLKLKLKIR